MDEVLTIAPPPEAIIYGAAYLQRRNPLVNVPRSEASHSFKDVSAMDVEG
ncbi:hypothetical protein GCM10010911_01670 [Paenibacillus nasutitermitis]|uniref:Uncharacterized protein n=1 Tax=Paenibacillus nasutitermitis TaxID=1652958 RepID=A0A916YJM6_9BACL|nr:hypothetical protein GCM10010911_01670 [Paenibacillus nasutitermitis]